MEFNCHNEYQRFKQFHTLSSHINDIYDLIKVKLNNIEHKIHGGQNLMKIFHINDIVQIAEKCKNNTKLCEVLSLLYTSDVNVYCNTQKDMIDFIKVLGQIFHNKVLDNISNTNNSKDFNHLFNNIKLPKAQELDRQYNYLANYVKSIITTQINDYNDDYDYMFTIKNIPHPQVDNSKFMFRPGEIMFLTIDFISTRTNKIYNYKLFTIHVATKEQLEYELQIGNSTGTFQKFIIELDMYLYSIMSAFFSIAHNISCQDKTKVESLLGINLTNKSIIDNFNLEINLQKLYGNDLKDRLHLINLILDIDQKIKFRIQRVLLCLNMFANKFVNNLIFEEIDDNFLKLTSTHDKIVTLFNFYVRLGIFFGINIIYIDQLKNNISTFNSSDDKEQFITQIKKLITKENIEDLCKSIVSNNENLRGTLAFDVNLPINSTTEISIIYTIDIPGSEVLYSNLYYNLDAYFYPTQNSPTIPIPLNDRTKELFKSYIDEVIKYDKDDYENVIYDYTNKYYIQLVEYIHREIYNPSKIQYDQDDNYKKHIHFIYVFNYRLSKKFNKQLFDETKSKYIYVFRAENSLNFGNASTYLSLPIDSEFTNPYPMSTGIDKSILADKKNIYLRIRLKADDIFSLILTHSQHPTEKEILLPQGTVFKLIQRKILKFKKNTSNNNPGSIIYLIDLVIIKNNYLTDLETIKNNYDKIFRDFINFYKNNYISNKLYFSLIQDKALICDIGVVDKYISKLYNAIYSRTIPLLFEDKTTNIKKIIKGYLYRKNIHKAFNDYNDITHPLNIEIKLLELTSNLLKLESPPTPHLINSFGKTNNCDLETFVKYVKTKICSRFSDNWICEDSKEDSKMEFFNKMKFVAIEYGEEGTLTNMLASKKIDTANKLYEIFFQIFYTLAIMYDYYNFVHFDLHPDNILFCKDKNYTNDQQKYYQYIYNDTVYHIPIREYIVKIADYDASFYNGINNSLITGDNFHMNKVKEISYGKLDIYLIFNLLTENKNKDCLRLINEIKDGDGDNYISKLVAIFRNPPVDFINVPLINELLTTKEILGISVFNFEKIEKPDLIHTKYTHNSQKIYENLIISPQEHDTQVGHNLLQNSIQFKLDSIQKLSILRNNSHSLRIMTYNVHEWTDSSGKININGILNDILLVFPDILCLQEHKLGPLSIQSKQTIIFHQYYEHGASCSADNNLLNTIFVKKTIKPRIKILGPLGHNIGENTKHKDAKERCMNAIEYTFKDRINKINIFNTHLHYDNTNEDTFINFQNALKIINEISKSGAEIIDKIILGDFNSYCEYDYPDMPISYCKYDYPNMTIHEKSILDDFNSAKKDLVKNNPRESLFSVCDYINKPHIGLIDMYDSYLKGIYSFFKYNKSYIPLNTNRYGGRIDLMFWNKDNKQQLLGIYKLYSEESDHSPIICDLYDPLPRFNEGEKMMTFTDYVKRNIVNGDNHVDYSLDLIDYNIDISYNSNINSNYQQSPSMVQLEQSYTDNIKVLRNKLDEAEKSYTDNINVLRNKLDEAKESTNKNILDNKYIEYFNISACKLIELYNININIKTTNLRRDKYKYGDDDIDFKNLGNSLKVGFVIKKLKKKKRLY